MKKRKAVLKAEAPALALRMSEFLTLARPTLRQKPPPAHVVTAQSLDRTLGQIRPARLRANAAGAFVNVWTVAGLRRNELRNAAVLAWFLDPKGTHGLGGLFIKDLLTRIRPVPEWLAQERDFDDLLVHTEECPIGSTENRIDISITAPGYLMFIEVKIDAPEGPDQLARYVREIAVKARAHGAHRSLVIYLTPRGRLPVGLAELAALSWRDVEKAAMAVANALPESDQRRAPIFQFSLHVQSF